MMKAAMWMARFERKLVRFVASSPDQFRSVSHVVRLKDVACGVEQFSKKEVNPVQVVVKP